MAQKVIVQPNGVGGSNGTWAKENGTDTFEATADLAEARRVDANLVDYVISVMDSGGTLGLYSSNPSTPPPPPPGV